MYASMQFGKCQPCILLSNSSGANSTVFACELKAAVRAEVGNGNVGSYQMFGLRCGTI